MLFNSIVYSLLCVDLDKQSNAQFCLGEPEILVSLNTFSSAELLRLPCVRQTAPNLFGCFQQDDRNTMILVCPFQLY
jgi:hypothetical protein